ncbi:MAG: hypothetical protein EAX96_13165 [Candidatus Lokiarchaeota archaeon]|nr:hypothetical protein [Candidatus Lokiarchaeota archaeon]
MSELLLENIFNLRGYKHLLDNLEKKIIDKFNKLDALNKNKLNTNKINEFTNILIGFGGNRTQSSLEKEIELVGGKFRNLTNYGALILIGPKIYNNLLEKITNRGNYTSYEALYLDIIFDLIIPIYKYIKKMSTLSTKEVFCLIHGLLLEIPTDLNLFPYFLEIEESYGFFESFNLLNLSPYKEKLMRMEEEFERNRKKEDFLDVIKSKYQLGDLNLEKVTDTMKPMQRIFSPIGNIERLITTIKVTKRQIDENQKEIIEKSIYSIIRSIYELYSKEMVGKNQNFENFLNEIAENFSNLLEISKDLLLNELRNKIYGDYARDIIKTSTIFIKNEIINHILKSY